VNAVSVRVRELRKELGLRREDLAAKAGISLNTVASVERGAGSHTGTLEAIAEALGVDIAQLFDGKAAKAS